MFSDFLIKSSSKLLKKKIIEIVDIGVCKIIEIIEIVNIIIEIT